MLQSHAWFSATQQFPGYLYTDDDSQAQHCAQQQGLKQKHTHAIFNASQKLFLSFYNTDNAAHACLSFLNKRGPRESHQAASFVCVTFTDSVTCTRSLYRRVAPTTMIRIGRITTQRVRPKFQEAGQCARGTI